jgi:aspartate/methionine/tyrosine aminotransferase
LYESGISLAGLSKSYALPGLRLGWLASRAPGLVADWLKIKDYTTICHSAPSEVLGLIALRAGDRLLARNLEIVRGNLVLAREYFGGRPQQFRWMPPQAGSIAFPAWTGPGTIEALCQAALEREGLLVVPGSIFEYPGSHFRVGLGRQNFPEALASFERVVNRL